MKNPRNRARREPTKAAPKKQIHVFSLDGDHEFISRREMLDAAAMYRGFGESLHDIQPEELMDMVGASKAVAALAVFAAGHRPIARN